MCLTACRVTTEKFQKEKKGMLTVYKAYQTDPDTRELYSPFVSDMKGSRITGPGEIVSNRRKPNVKWAKNRVYLGYEKKTGEDLYGDGADVDRGIHVYLKRQDAQDLAEFELGVVVPLYVDVKDIVGVSNLEGSGDTHAVFMKATLTEAAWRKVFPLTETEKAEARSQAAKKAACTRKRKAAGRSAAAKKAAATRAAKKVR